MIYRKNSKVFYNPTNGWAVVAHTGTYSGADWWNNFKFAVGGESAYKLTDRYKWSERVQMKAEKNTDKKYYYDWSLTRWIISRIFRKKYSGNNYTK